MDAPHLSFKPLEAPNSVPQLTRRNLLAKGACVLAGTALPLPSYLFSEEQQTPSAPIGPVMQTLSTYMAQAATRPLPPAIIEQAKDHILDTFAAMISGSQLPPGRAAIAFAQSYGGKPVASVATSVILCGPLEAALANGVLAHSDETDDSHSPSQSHPGCAVVPAALAVGEQFNISGSHFLRAVTLGYDIGPRFGVTLGGVNYQTETHRDPHATSEGFGAAAAAGCAASLDVRQMRLLLDYASQQSSGFTAWQRDTLHVEKAFVFAGMPARNGVTSALLVQAGWSGVDDVLSGPESFFAAYAPHANPQGLAKNLVGGLGEHYEITRTNIKKWCVGSPIQAPLDAVQLLLNQHSFTPDQVRHVTVKVATREATIVDNRALPDICLQHLVAVMLVQRTLTFRSAHDAALMKDSGILQQRAKVTLIGDEELEKRLPAREATVEILLNDGTVLTQHVDAVRGTAENPMSREEIIAKSRDLIEPVLGPASSKALISAVLQLEQLTDIHTLSRLLRSSS
ncbi:MmgE/PrpD family protein [Tunturiibacter empetritectus]|uniref:2-methylcitrate dehydratase PrpD n=1 Tax=Tunturiibacter lichenicola TaxID=2051959 RepID=A0A852VHJ9_9BACT|nr:MmgE/PrpD family protein [Edaphobacter lichenicola]NYF91110.1 2-methylcitrate dehydratase PrpD [Edaphobacter lichenicola]